MARKIVITSGKGGVGKTTVAANLAACLAKKGARVVLCDADLGLNNVDVVTGIEHLIVYDLVDVIEGRCRAAQALIRHPDFATLYVFTSCHAAPERYVSPQSFTLVLERIAPKFDYIIIDCPAGIDDGFHRAVSAADEAIIVTTPHISALRDADKVITLLKSYQCSSVTVAINKVRGDLLAVGECLSPKEIEELLKTPIVGVIPEEYAIYAGGITDAHGAFKILATNVHLGKKKIYDTTKKYVGFLGGIRRLARKKL